MKKAISGVQEWATSSEFMKSQKRAKGWKPRPKVKTETKRGARKKVSDEIQEEIKWFCDNTSNSLERLAKRFKLSTSTIVKIRDGSY